MKNTNTSCAKLYQLNYISIRLCTDINMIRIVIIEKRTDFQLHAPIQINALLTKNAPSNIIARAITVIVLFFVLVH